MARDEGLIRMETKLAVTNTILTWILSRVENKGDDADFLYFFGVLVLRRKLKATGKHVSAQRNVRVMYKKKFPPAKASPSTQLANQA
jgi:hypothetical protein